jgi:hypothetical protein
VIPFQGINFHFNKNLQVEFHTWYHLIPYGFQGENWLETLGDFDFFLYMHNIDFNLP